MQASEVSRGNEQVSVASWRKGLEADFAFAVGETFEDNNGATVTVVVTP